MEQEAQYNLSLRSVWAQAFQLGKSRERSVQPKRKVGRERPERGIALISFFNDVLGLGMKAIHLEDVEILRQAQRTQRALVEWRKRVSKRQVGQSTKLFVLQEQRIERGGDNLRLLT
jgi:hypothetical protein